MGNFNRTLNFTSANEDGATELAALRLGPADHVLCLTASGARPLDLLLGNPGKITAIDINPAQNELLRLKMAAYRTLDDEALYGFLGITACRHRETLFQAVATELPPTSRTYWQGRRAAIRAGVWNAGRWERVLRFGAKGTRLLRGRHIDALFAAATLEEQTQIWDQRFDDSLWHSAVRILSQRWFWTQVIGEPGGAFLPEPRISEARLTSLFRRAASSFFFRDSDLASLVFLGRRSLDGALPLHLQPEHLNTVRAGLDCIAIADAGLTELGRLYSRAFDAFSLSDFGSYCSQAAYDACWRGVLASARPGARFCERIFMNPVEPGPSVQRQIVVNSEYGATLSLRDKAIIYDIRCGTLQPQG